MAWLGELRIRLRKSVTMTPLDLTAHPPRSAYLELGGLLLLARTIDKLRARLPGGNSGVYFINGQIPGISAYLLGRLGVTEDDLQRVVAEAENEADVVDWIAGRTDASAYPAINATLRQIEVRHAQDPEYLRTLYAPTLEMQPELVRLLDILDADDRRMFGAGEIGYRRGE